MRYHRSMARRMIVTAIVSLALVACGQEVSSTAGVASQAAQQNTVATDARADAPAVAHRQETVMSSTDKVVRTEEEWRRILTPEQYYVLREKGTERPFVNKYDHHFEPGTYACAGCGLELFESDTKFNSGCGWPAFYAAKAGDRVKLQPDYSHNMVRTEVLCARCESHLGHIFDDAPQTPTGQRYCINSVALTFIPADKKKAE